jgi:hypothetical protein
MKSINLKGEQALRNSPVGYFSVVARLKGWHSSQRSQRTEFNDFIFAYFAFLSTAALAEVDFVCSAVKYFFSKSLKHLILL